MPLLLQRAPEFKIRLTENHSFLVLVLCQNSSPVAIQCILLSFIYSGVYRCHQHAVFSTHAVSFLTRKCNLLQSYVLQILHSITVNIHKIKDMELPSNEEFSLGFSLS